MFWPLDSSAEDSWGPSSSLASEEGPRRGVGGLERASGAEGPNPGEAGHRCDSRGVWGAVQAVLRLQEGGRRSACRSRTGPRRLRRGGRERCRKAVERREKANCLNKSSSSLHVHRVSLKAVSPFSVSHCPSGAEPSSRSPIPNNLPLCDIPSLGLLSRL